ncbi:MAG: Uma2 family endonuclease [Hyphomonadaceae bacterium]|nr:Uma2 family endonuclease [Hyphomonadaceae bacterium]
MNAPVRPILMTDADFDRFLASGASAALGRVELRGGALVQMSPQNLPHGRLKFWIAKQLDAAVAAAGGAFVVDAYVTVRFGQGFQPLPDVTAWTGGPMVGTIPGEKVRLIVEVADSTLADDLGDKRADYARAGLPEYWVLDVNARCVHRFHAPGGDAFAKADVFRDGERIEAATLPGVGFVLGMPG